MDKRLEDDIDAFMAEIMGGNTAQGPQKRAPQHAAVPKKTFHQPAATRKNAQASPVNNLPSKKRRSAKPIFATLFILMIIAGLGYLGYAKKDMVTGLFLPPSPFTKEVKQSVQFPLYYPTKMPGTFKFQTGTITQPEGGIVVYRLTNDTETAAVTVSQQAPANVDIDKLYETASGVVKFPSAAGSVWIGTMSDGTLVANVVGPQTWLIATTSSSVVSPDEMRQLIESLRQG